MFQVKPATLDDLYPANEYQEIGQEDYSQEDDSMMDEDERGFIEKYERPIFKSVTATDVKLRTAGNFRRPILKPSPKITPGNLTKPLRVSFSQEDPRMSVKVRLYWIPLRYFKSRKCKNVIC